MMHQLVVTYKIKPFTWSDGTPASVGDMELGYKIDCDKDSGATSFITCDAIQDVRVRHRQHQVTVTYLPGYQDPTYYFVPFRPLPQPPGAVRWPQPGRRARQ